MSLSVHVHDKKKDILVLGNVAKVSDHAGAIVPQKTFYQKNCKTLKQFHADIYHILDF